MTFISIKPERADTAEISAQVRAAIKLAEVEAARPVVAKSAPVAAPKPPAETAPKPEPKTLQMGVALRCAATARECAQSLLAKDTPKNNPFGLIEPRDRQAAKIAEVENFHNRHVNETGRYYKGRGTPSCNI